ncbi:hypothetical protein MMC19_000785 [Ptychographa xylographoides]|nr:hypothetical protein [Ptychographa xylographoides]
MALFHEKEVGPDPPSSVPSTPTTPRQPLTLPLTDKDLDITITTTSQCPTPTSSTYNPVSSHPFSPFYSHPTTRTSFEQLKSTTTSTPALATTIKVYELGPDLEAGSRTRLSSEPPTTIGSSREGSVWPDKSARLRQTMERKRQRGCACMARLSTRQKWVVKVAIAVLVVGCAVGLGVGIGKVVGARVYKSQGQTQVIGDGS